MLAKEHRRMPECIDVISIRSDLDFIRNEIRNREKFNYVLTCITKNKMPNGLSDSVMNAAFHILKVLNYNPNIAKEVLDQALNAKKNGFGAIVPDSCISL